MNGTFIDADHWKGAQILDEITAIVQERRDLQLIEMLKPEFSKDGNQYCYLYGTLPNDCVVGFGDTAYSAMTDFSRNFYSSKAQINPPKTNQQQALT